jgi:hypothetical protein
MKYMPFVIYSPHMKQYMKMCSIPAAAKWTSDVAEAMFFDDYAHANLWFDFLDNCQILESTSGGWADVTRK